MLVLLLSLFITYSTAEIKLEYPKDEHLCLSRSIYHESRGEPIDGQIMVANVIMNRVKHDEFPNTICSVVHQKNQFEWTQVVSKNRWNTNIKSDIISYMFIYADKLGVNLAVSDVTFFSVGGFQNKRLSYEFTIGAHKFYSITN